MDMLTQEDLKKIGEVVDQRIEAKVSPMIDEKLDKKLEEHTETILSVVKKGFDGVDEKFSAVRQEMAEMKHELMDHTDRVVEKAVGNLRSELREHNVIA